MLRIMTNWVFILIMLTLIGFTCFFLEPLNSILLLDKLRIENVMYSTAYMLYMLCYTLAITLGGFIYDTLGMRSIYLATIGSLISASLTFSLGTLILNYILVYIAFSLYGLSSGLLYSITPLSSLIIPEEYRGTFMGIAQACLRISRVIAPFLATIIATKLLNLSLTYIFALIIASMSLFILFIRYGKIEKTKHDTHRRYRNRINLTSALMSIKDTLIVIVREPRLRDFLIADVIDGIGGGLIIGLGLAYALTIANINRSLVGALLSLQSLVWIAFSIIAGRIHDRIKDPWPLITLHFLLNAIFAILIISFPSFIGLCVAFIVLGISYAIYGVSIHLYILQSSPSHMRGKVFGLINIIIRGIITPLPILGGVLWRLFGLSFVFILRAIFAFVAALYFSILAYISNERY